MPRSYAEQFKVINATSMASELGHSALELARTIESAPEDRQPDILAGGVGQLIQDSIKLVEVSAFELVDDVKYRRVPPQVFTELNNLSLGYSEEEAGAKRGVPKTTVKSWRKEIKTFMKTRTRNDTVAQAIQRGLVHIDIDRSRTTKNLSWMEDRVLAFAAAGWTTREIAERFNLSPNTLDRHYEEIRLKLDAKNMPHAVRRAFEVGIFDVGEPIMTSVETAEDASVSVFGESGRVTVKITDPREIDLLKKMAKIGNGSITARQAIEAEGLAQPGKMPHVGRTMLSLSEQLEAAAGSPVIVKSRLSIAGKKTHLYRLTSGLTLDIGGKSMTIPEFKPPQKLKGGRPASKVVPTKKATNNKVLRPASIKSTLEQTTLSKPGIKRNLDPTRAERPTSDIIARENLPAFDSNLAEMLSARDWQEEINCRSVRNAVDYLSRQKVLDYRTKVVLFLRYGIEAAAPIQINRSGDIIPTPAVTAAIPSGQGLDLASTSLVCGLTAKAIYKAERDFVAAHQADFPALSGLEKVLKAEFENLESEK